MRKIGLEEIEDIALGAALLGAGGGGDPYIGKLVAIGAVKECGPVTLLDPEEVPDDALVVPIAMMGAPTILGEKAVGEMSTRRCIAWFPGSMEKKSMHLCRLRQVASTVCCRSLLLHASGSRWWMRMAWDGRFRSFRW